MASGRSGALMIGVGILPVLFALAWVLGGPVETREDRTLLGLFVGLSIGFVLYAAVKASFLATTFAIRVEERNLIYLSPIVFVVAARWLLERRVRPFPVAIAAAACGWLLWSTPYHAYEHLYSDALGLSILQWLNQTWAFTIDDLRWLLFAILAAGIGFAVLLRSSATRTVVVATALVGCATVAWNLTGEISAANQAVAPAKFQRSLIPTPPDWIDRETGRSRTIFLGKSLSGSLAFWTLEFWNQSLQDVWSVDASAPPPGPTVTPDFQGTDGAVSPQLPDEWAVTQPEITMAGNLAEHAGGLDLYRLTRPIRMVSFVSGITPDGWMVEGDMSAFVRFAKQPTPGTLTISVSRTAACGGQAPFALHVPRLGPAHRLAGAARGRASSADRPNDGALDSMRAEALARGRGRAAPRRRHGRRVVHRGRRTQAGRAGRLLDSRRRPAARARAAARGACARSGRSRPSARASAASATACRSPPGARA